MTVRIGRAAARGPDAGGRRAHRPRAVVIEAMIAALLSLACALMYGFVLPALFGIE